jgi:O-acetyl-ADP-ribose deacetylase (regulator of RNase III)
LSSSENKTSMQFLFGDRELWIGIHDLLTTQVEVIVSPSDSQLLYADGLTGKILAAAGDHLETQRRQLIQEYGQIDSGMAVYTTAGKLPYKAVIHAVGLSGGESEEQHKIEQAVSRSLLLCEANEWSSIAFPAIGTGFPNVPIEISAQAFFRSITHFWDARHESAVEKVMICLEEDTFRPFFDAFREDAITTTDEQPIITSQVEESIGHIELDEAEIADLADDDMADWFK